LSCNSKQENDNSRTYNATYQIASIPEMESFNTYTEIERIMDSSMNQFSQNDFSNNRSRIFIHTFINNKLQQGESTKYESLPMPCACYTEKDTIYVNITIGFFAGLGYNIKIYKDRFESNYFEYTDDVKPYKANITDSAFTDYLLAKSKDQYLILNKKPTFKLDEELIGFLTLTSNNYYSIGIGSSLDTSYVSGKLYFKCKVKQKDHWMDAN
jgi:hypothetical protein